MDAYAVTLRDGELRAARGAPALTDLSGCTRPGPGG
jgi:hypothetical protein